MMQCDYNALKEYASLLNKRFNQIRESMNDIENSYKDIVSTNNWSSITREYFYLDNYSKMLINYDTLQNKFNNVNLYLEQVINNYIAFEQAMSQSFGGV